MAAAVESPLGTLNATHGLPQMPPRVQLPTRHSLRPGSRSSRASSRGSQTAPSHEEQTQSTEDQEVEKDKEKANDKEKESGDAQQQQQETQADAPSGAPQQQGAAARKEGFLGEDFDPTHGAKPYSPFYIHPMTETSKMQLHNEREAIRAGTRSSESNDLESGGIRSHAGGVGGVGGAGKDSTSTRPSCDERWELIHKNKKRGWLARFSPRTRFVIKMLLASAVICVMFAVGIGLTLAVSGRPWPATGPTKSD
ncbi:hypothetical protein KEM56_002595 [Ascosphaera pollenicola]|nr:hypothetical protein KEM56_002595 [Ascosphaera pollenicola]